MKKRAFTLVEVLVSLSILAMCAIFLMPAIYSNKLGVNADSSKIRLSMHAQTIIENYKAGHFGGYDIDLNLPEDIDYELSETENGRFIVVELRVNNDNEEYKTKIALPKETSIYTD